MNLLVDQPDYDGHQSEIESGATTLRTSGRWIMRTRVLQCVKVVALFLLPSFVRKTPKSAPSSQDIRRVFLTVYLDGLRGLFSFFVFVRHFLLPWEPWLDKGFAQTDIEAPTKMDLWRLPVVRLVYAGPSVPIFFIISGFVLAYKPLKLIRCGDLDTMGRGIISSIFRRPLRLFVPPLVTTFFVAVAVGTGRWTSPYDAMPGWEPRHPERLESVLAQLSDWTRFALADLTHSWSWRSPQSEYDSHLWTIPIQFRASMIVFLTLMGLARANPLARGTILVALWLYSLLQDRWEMALFFAGVLLAERSLEKMVEDTRRQGDPLSVTFAEADAANSSPALWKRMLWRCMFLLGLYLSSFPRARHAGPVTPGFAWMSSLTDRYIYWQTYGATLLVWAMSNDTALQRPFTWPLLKYMGLISFSLYLVHGPALHFFGYSIVAALQKAIGYQPGVALAFFLFTPIVIWIADVFWRAVDKPCALLVTRLELICCR